VLPPLPVLACLPTSANIGILCILSPPPRISALLLKLLQMASIPDVDLSQVGTTKFGSFEVEVVDFTTEYFDTLKVGGETGSCLAASRSMGVGSAVHLMRPPAANNR
jgi:hypothetical protein